MESHIRSPHTSSTELCPMAPVPTNKKVVFILGATGTGKSKLAVGLASRFGGEVVNSDKMQIYDGLDVITNKTAAAERAGIPHHLIGRVPPGADFSAADFRRAASLAVGSILARGRLPIVAGGSNSYIEELVEGNHGEFRWRYDCVFLWVDVDSPALHSFVAGRVDDMVGRGLVEEARGVFDPASSDYSKGIRKAIGVREMDWYLRTEGEIMEEEERAGFLAAAIDEIKANTCKLACCQREKIRRLAALEGWDVRRVDATAVFGKRGEVAEKAWERVVRESVEIVDGFLEKGRNGGSDGIGNSLNVANGRVVSASATALMVAVGTVALSEMIGWPSETGVVSPAPELLAGK